MIKLDDIHVYYGDSYILQGVSLNVQAGEIVCLLGRNGAGKTTTMRGIMGYNPPARGSVNFDGRDITGQAVYTNVRQGDRICSRRPADFSGPHGHGKPGRGDPSGAPGTDGLERGKNF